MLIVVWIVSVLLAVMYTGAGLVKIIRSREQLAPMLPWVDDFSPSAVKLIGTVEVLGAIGLVVPAATGIVPILTPLAAVGLGLVQLVAMVVHARRGERRMLPFNAVLLALAGFVAIARFAGV